MRSVFVTTVALLVLAGLFLAYFLPVKEHDSPVVPHEQAESLLPLLPSVCPEPDGRLAEVSSLCAQNVPSTVRSSPEVPKEPPPVQTLPKPTASGVTTSYVFFYTGMPVRPAPTTTFVYVGGTVPVIQPIQPTVVSMVPVVPTTAVPIFTPRVVPSRVGPPKLVYSNGVVIKPQVYFPRQPVRNSVRAFTP